MKTKYIILSFSLAALTTTGFAQLNSIKERLFSRNNDQLVFVNADFGAGSSRMESWMHDFQGWTNERFSHAIYKDPVVTNTFYLDKVEVIYEEELFMEDFMAAPFKNVFVEEAIALEPWMSTPFETGLAEETLSQEPWMAVPFGKELTQEIMPLESWMVTPFENGLVEKVVLLESWMGIPFENGLTEALVYLETWMTTPFGAEEDIEIEAWMATPWF